MIDVLNPVKKILDLLYPRACPVCAKTLTVGEEYLCSFCISNFPFRHQDYPEENDFPENLPRTLVTGDMHTLFYYNKYSKFRHLVYAIKYKQRKKLAIYLGKMLGERIGDMGIDFIIPVPLHPKRERKRGFNQSRLIAEGIAGVLGKDVTDDFLIRIHNNESQTGKNAEERIENVRDIFEWRYLDELEGRHILLVDDVLTTGSTIASCINSLDHLKNIRISIACLSRTLDRD